MSDTNGNTNRKEAILNVDKDLHPGWPQLISGKAGYTSHPVFSDLDGDGDKEIVVGSDSGYVYVWNHDGTIVSGWPKQINLEFPPNTGSAQDDASTPSLGDIDNEFGL